MKYGHSKLILNKSVCIYLPVIVGCLLGSFNSTADNVIPYCIDPNWLPYEANENNQHIGLSADYMQLLEQQTDYEFKLIPTVDWQQSLQYIKTGECMLLPMLNESAERLKYMDFSEVYFSAPNFLVSVLDKPFVQNIDNIGQQTLGVTKGYRNTEYIAKEHPWINTIKFETEADGLTAVANGDVDFFVGSIHSINYHMQRLGLSNLKLAGAWGGPDDALRMGIIKGQKSFLVEINQALAQISQQQHFEIFNRWNDVTVIDKTNYGLIWQVSLAALLVLFLLVLRYLSVRKYNRILTVKNSQLKELQLKLIEANNELQTISQHDDLTGLYNRHYFNQFIATDAKHDTDFIPHCLILIDLDFFKAINDNHGHVMGDAVLKSFAQLLSDCCDEGELVCRWGGEEFIVLKQTPTYTEALKLCKKIRYAMKHKDFPHQKPLTCSIGVAQQMANERLTDCFDRADKMLYQAKNQGRNRVCASIKK